MEFSWLNASRYTQVTPLIRALGHSAFLGQRRRRPSCVGADAEVSHAPGLRRAGLSALKFKLDAACRSFSLVQLPVGRWLKLALALTSFNQTLSPAPQHAA